MPVIAACLLEQINRDMQGGDLYSQQILLIEVEPGHDGASRPLSGRPGPDRRRPPKLYLALGLPKPVRVVELFTRRRKLRNG